MDKQINAGSETTAGTGKKANASSCMTQYTVEDHQIQILVQWCSMAEEIQPKANNQTNATSLAKATAILVVNANSITILLESISSKNMNTRYLKNSLRRQEDSQVLVSAALAVKN